MWRDRDSGRMSLDLYWRGWSNQHIKKGGDRTMTTMINNVIKKIKAILGFHGVSDSDVLKAGNTVYDGMLNNSAFPTPPVLLPVFRQALDSFSALIVDAEDGGKKSITAKNKQREEVLRLYTLLGHYVEAT